ncbi:reverse transcriptase domain-containing protein [Tanacetum coccineum]
MSVRLADRSFQYPIGIAANMLVEVSKFTFLADFVILKIEEDNKVPLILGRPFLHIADVVIRVKQKQLNLGVRTERMIFNIDSAMKHSYSNEDTCFSIDVIDEILEEYFDTLLDEGSKILHSIDGTLLEEEIFSEFDEFMALTADKNSESKSDTEEPPFDKITINTDYKIKTSLEEPPTDLELKSLPDNLESIFLEEPYFLPVIISSKLSAQNKTNLYLFLRNIRKPLPGKRQMFLVSVHHSVNTRYNFWMTRNQLSKNKEEFNIEIKDRKGTKNVVVDHLSRIENEEISDDSEVDDNFLGETRMEINTIDEPWFADFANDLEPYLFKVCSDSMIRRCISGLETRTILDQCHHGPTNGHYGPNVTAKKVLDSGSYWPTIIKEAHTLVRLCEACQKTGNISKRDEMPLNNIQVCEIFDVCGIDFMGPLLKSHKFEYILVAVNYVSKWAEAQALPTNDARVVITFLKKLFCRFGMLKALISDRGTYFCNKIMEKTMKRYRVNHRFSISYHPQTSGEVENTNISLKRIIEKTVKDNLAIWSRKLDDALWAFCIVYKTPTGTTPYKLIYGKNYHLPFEIEHRAYWALKNCNPDLIAAGEKKMFQLHELDELRHQAYENSRLYKARTKVWHDRRLRMRKEFKHENKWYWLIIIFERAGNLEALELVLDHRLLDRNLSHVMNPASFYSCKHSL